MLIFRQFPEDFGQVRETLKQSFQEMITVSFEGAYLIISMIAVSSSAETCLNC